MQSAQGPLQVGALQIDGGRHAAEFWECSADDMDVERARSAPLAWEHCYNTLHPHQALDYLTPLHYLQTCISQPKE